MKIDRAARLSGAVNRAFAETISFRAMCRSDDVDLPFVADASRATFEIQGVFWKDGKSTHPKARGAVQDDNAPRVSVSMPRVVIAASAPWMPVEGDRVVVESGGEYVVSRARPDGLGNIYVYMTARKRQ